MSTGKVEQFVVHFFSHAPLRICEEGRAWDGAPEAGPEMRLRSLRRQYIIGDRVMDSTGFVVPSIVWIGPNFHARTNTPKLVTGRPAGAKQQAVYR